MNTIRSLVSHLWKTNRPEIIARSRRNCHAKGLHSVMLAESPGKTIRLFFANWDHELYHNRLGLTGARAPLSVAVHPHHCPITLATVLGHFVNERAHLARLGDSDYGRAAALTMYWPTFEQFVFDSKLLGGKGGFVRGKSGKFKYQADSKKVRAGESVFMDSVDLHTVYVPKEERAAWLVFEGASDPGHTSVAYSNTDLTTFTSEGLYQPVDGAEIERWLTIAGLL